MELLAAVASGVAFGLSLIVAVGPQNAFVLRQGILRSHVVPLVAVCAASDVALIAAGTAGAGALLTGRRWATLALGIAGAGFLLWYAAGALRRAVRGGPAVTAAASPPSLRGVLLACLAFTWLNPGVYVDTVVLVGPVSHAHGSLAWWFAGGAMLASVAWFAALGVGGRALGPVLARPGAQRVLDAGIAVVLLLTAVRLLASSA